VSDTNKKALARMMVGREVKSSLEKPPVKPGGELLRVDGVRAKSDRGSEVLRGIRFSLAEGEVLGIAGVDGNGQEELVETIVGLRKVDEGRITIKGCNTTGKSPKYVYSLGVACIPSDRQKKGMVQAFSVKENLVLEAHDGPRFSSRGFLRIHDIAAFARKIITDFDIRTPSENTPARLLSGGNLQKMVLGRALSREPRLLIAAQPTRGLDVTATQFVHTELIKQRTKGVGVLLVSADLDEILAVSDRIAVVFEGQIVGVMDRQEADVESIGLMMAGGRRTQPLVS
jgi:simple sugar transport system ATP-binding protein